MYLEVKPQVELYLNGKHVLLIGTNEAHVCSTAVEECAG